MDKRKLDPAQEQLIIARSLLWTPELDKLLRRWKRQIEKRERAHTNISNKKNKYHYLVGVPLVLLNTLSSTGGVSTFRNCDSCDEDADCDADEWLRLFFSIMGMLAAAMAGIMTFMSFAEVAETHKTAADDFRSLSLQLDAMLIVPGPIRGDPISTLQSIRNQYSDIIRKSPQLPERFQLELSYNVINPEKLPKPPSPDEIKIDDDTTQVLQDVLKDSTPEGSQGMEELSEKIAKENEYDTSDEDHEVCITFDLDSSMRFNDPAKVAMAAAQLASHREEQVQKSFQRSLIFEMDRLEKHSETAKKLSRKHTKKKI